MKVSRFHFYGISCIVAALLAGCGSGTPSAVDLPASNAPNTRPHRHTFRYTGKEQSFVVPAEVERIKVVARGAAGNGYSYKNSYGYFEYFGRGGRVVAIIPVREGEKLYIFVGGRGTSTGGFNGGGNPGGEASESDGFGGGGSSDVREGGDALRDRILVVGGGGGQGYSWQRDADGFGGMGGGAVGGTGGSYGMGGGGGALKSGGVGGAGGSGASGSSPGQPGDPGSKGRGGDGGQGGAGSGSNAGGGGGGGGGGYYGGGGGGGGVAQYPEYGQPGGGGGGGSSYIEPTATKFQSWQGWENATSDGLVVFSWK